MHQLVHNVVEAYLQEADALAPGLIEGVYLTGSAALGDFRPGASDIDFVAVIAQPSDEAVTTVLERAHRRLRRRYRRPFFDGVYVTWSDLARDPTRLQQGPHTHEGRFNARGAGTLDPVTWHTLARYGVTCRGPSPREFDVWTDPDVLASWTDDNLDRYWRRWVDRCSRAFTPFGLFSLTDYASVWCVTGVARLHYTLATGDIASKTGAARYALEVFPERWHRVVQEALRLRTGAEGPALYRTPLSRRRDMLAFGHMAIQEAHRLYVR